jgi:hypothetical protein
MPQTDSSPSEFPFAITPSDTVALTHAIRGFSVAVGGTVKVTRLDGSTDTLTLPAGVCPARVLLIWATGTTATGFVGYADR